MNGYETLLSLSMDSKLVHELKAFVEERKDPSESFVIKVPTLVPFFFFFFSLSLLFLFLFLTLDIELNIFPPFLPMEI